MLPISHPHFCKPSRSLPPFHGLTSRAARQRAAGKRQIRPALANLADLAASGPIGREDAMSGDESDGDWAPKESALARVDSVSGCVVVNVREAGNIGRMA